MDLGKTKFPLFGVPTGIYHFNEVIGPLQQIANALQILLTEQQRSPGTVTFPCAHDIVKGKALNIVNGTFQYADRTGALPAHAISISNGSITKPVKAVLLQGYTSNLSGLTPNAHYWLDAAGAITTVKPATGVIQCLGFALSATEMLVNINSPT